MAQEIRISFVGPDRTGLIAHITNYLSDKGVNIGDITFAVLGDHAELTLIHALPRGVTMEEIEKDLQAMPELADGALEVGPYHFKEDRGPSSTITHRITLSGDDIPGLIAKISKALDDHGANIVRMDSENIPGGGEGVYLIRFEVWLPPERAASCLAATGNTAGSLGLSCKSEVV